jgi:hypothetical protein
MLDAGLTICFSLLSSSFSSSSSGSSGAGETVSLVASRTAESVAAAVSVSVPVSVGCAADSAGMGDAERFLDSRGAVAGTDVAGGSGETDGEEGVESASESGIVVRVCGIAKVVLFWVSGGGVDVIGEGW